MSDLITAVQEEVARLREMIATVKALAPNGRVNFFFYDMAIKEAERAIREQDAIALVRILPELKEME